MINADCSFFPQRGHFRSALRGHRLLAMLGASLLTAPSAHSAPLTGDAVAGQREFSVCQGCHSVTPGKNGIGPSLAGVFGRQSGTVGDYNYSAAMKSVHVTWDATTLDRFLANPQAVVHGTKMFANVPNAATRRNIIAYLATLK